MSKNAAISLASEQPSVTHILNALEQVILGKPQQLRLALSCLLANGHLLIEDVPGVGKTTLAHTFARVLGLDFKRIQFTSDMLPADVIGVSIFRQEDASFELHRGPIFAQLVLADEVNRATPKTQSALLEAMEERQVSIDGNSHALPTPFFVIATQNPTEQVGTYALPESQLDRFLMRLSLGYPDREQERELLTGADRRSMLKELPAVVSGDGLNYLQSQVDKVHVAPALIDYVQDLIAFSRDNGRTVSGISPRAAIALVQAAKAWAYIEGRDSVTPRDIQVVVPAVVEHRMVFKPGVAESTNESVAEFLLGAVAIP